MAERGAKAPSPPASRCVLWHSAPKTTPRLRYSLLSLLSLHRGKKAQGMLQFATRPRTHSQCSDPVLPCQFCPALLDLEKNLKTLGKARGGFVHSKTDRKSVYVRTVHSNTQSTYFHRCCGLFCRFSILAGSTEMLIRRAEFYSLFGRFALVHGLRRNPILIAYPWTDLLLFWI